MSSSSYILQVLPVSWLGVALISLALVLFVLDLKVTNHGLPTIAGMASLVLGSLTLFDAASPYFWVSLMALMMLAILMGGILFVGVLSEVPAAKTRQATTGVESMIGEVGVVKEPVGASHPGWVFVHGEWWQAIAAVAPEDAHKRDRGQTIGVGRRVQVVDLRDGKVVAVLPLEPAAFEYSRQELG